MEPSTRRFRLRLARYRYQPDALTQELSSHPQEGPIRILDAGCGKGRLPRYWRRWAPGGSGVEMVGVDVSKPRLQRATTCGYDLLLRADLRRPWPLPDGSFHAAVCEQVLEHLEDEGVERVLSELGRVLKPGGVALIGTPVFTRLALALASAGRPLYDWLRRRGGRGPGSHLQHFTLDALRRAISRHGLDVEAARGFRLVSLPRNWLEDRRWWFGLQQRLGARFPSLCSEVTLICRKA